MNDDKREVLLVMDEAFEEVEYFWDQSLENYHDPKKFRFNVHELLQALRNFTFRLQSLKDSVPGFCDWYQPWQDYMKQSDVMQWINNARLDVVHKKGLESKSQASVRVINSYDVPVTGLLEVPPGLPNELLLAQVLREVKTDMGGRGIVEIARRWVLPTRPDLEILAGTSECVRVLFALKKNLEDLLERGESASPTDVVLVTQLDPRWCISLENLTTRIHVPSGRTLRHKQILFKYDESWADEAKERYGIDFDAPGQAPDDALVFAELLVPLARRVLSTDGNHAPMLWTHESNGWELNVTKFEDAEEKWAFWHRKAQEVGARVNGLVFISEVWLGSIQEVAIGIPPSQSPNRQEALQIYAETRDGRSLGLVMPFRHEGDQIVFEDTSRDSTKAWFTKPFRDIWSQAQSL